MKAKNIAVSLVVFLALSETYYLLTSPDISSPPIYVRLLPDMFYDEWVEKGTITQIQEHPRIAGLIVVAAPLYTITVKTKWREFEVSELDMESASDRRPQIGDYVMIPLRTPCGSKHPQTKNVFYNNRLQITFS